MTTANNPIHHTQKIKAQMGRLIDHRREDVVKVTEPKAQALLSYTSVRHLANNLPLERCGENSSGSPSERAVKATNHWNILLSGIS
jgi:hypothetical protein